MKHKLLLLSTAAVMAFAVPTASADSLSQKKHQVQQLKSRSEAVSQLVSKDKSQVQTLQTAVQAYTSSINAVQQQASSNQHQITQLNQQLSQLDDEITKDEQVLKQREDELQNDIRIMYEDGNTTYLEVLFQSSSFSDLLDRMESLAVISKHEKDLADQVHALKDTLVKEKQSKSTAVKSLQQRQQEYDGLIARKKELQAQKQQALSQASQQLSQDNQQKARLESQIRLTLDQIAEIERETQQADQKMKDPTYVHKAQSGLRTVDVSALIHYAEQYRGLPYIWGGTTPHPGFDCSGFVQYVFRHFGVSLPRVSQAQYGVGVPVSRSQLQPGDLVFFSTYAPGATHVGIYIGGGRMINAEDAGLMETSIYGYYWGARYLGARRVVRNG